MRPADANGEAAGHATVRKSGRQERLTFMVRPIGYCMNGAAVRAQELMAKLHGLLVDPGKVDDIPPLHERLERFRKDPVITRPPVSGEITRLPPLDGAD